MVSTKCSGITCLQNFMVWIVGTAYFTQWIYLVVAFNIIISSVSPVQAGIGDRHSRQLSELPQGDMNPEAVPPGTDPCSLFVNVTNMEFRSPATSLDDPTYTSNTECFLILEAPPQHLIKLDFRDYFQIEHSNNCKNDFLEIRDGPHGYNQILEHPFCGIDVFPPELTSSDRHLWIHFKSDETIEYKGFRAVFEYIPRPPNLKAPEIIPCNINLTDPNEGVLGKEEDIPKDIIAFDIHHDLPIDCLWEITVTEGWKIYLQFDKFTLEKPNDCDSNFVQVFSNKTDLPSQEKMFCGSIADTVLSKSHKMFVRFYSLYKGPKTLFKANYTAYRELESSKDEKCAKDTEFYCEDATCVHKDLKCNKAFNCRSRFDEEGCQPADGLAWSGDHMIIIMVIFSLILTGMCITFIYNCITKLIRDHQTIQEYMRQSEQQLNELDKQGQDKKQSSKVGSQSRSHSSPSTDSNRFDAANAVNTPCYVPGGDILPILVRSEHSMSPSNGDAYNTNIYTVDNDNPPEMCDSACQTRESLFTAQGYSSGNSTPNHSVHTNSPPAPFSTFGYKKDNKFKAEAKIEMMPQTLVNKYDEKRPYSVQTTKSAPDVIVTH